MITYSAVQILYIVIIAIITLQGFMFISVLVSTHSLTHVWVSGWLVDLFRVCLSAWLAA